MSRRERFFVARHSTDVCLSRDAQAAQAAHPPRSDAEGAVAMDEGADNTGSGRLVDHNHDETRRIIYNLPNYVAKLCEQEGYAYGV
ncbi:hypothetical protein FGB62_360g04 [Gracilaria domingensis]|nr:hypothetical protein FGB62_360g04 [Gracilaria domingensis]